MEESASAILDLQRPNFSTLLGLANALKQLSMFSYLFLIKHRDRFYDSISTLHIRWETADQHIEESCLEVQSYPAGKKNEESPVVSCKAAADWEMGDLSSSVLPASH